jgi:uncharacterized protein (TIGR00288 family)
VFIDFENIALGFQGRGTIVEFNVHRVLERLVEKGKVIVKKAYADWSRYPKYKTTLHQSAIELIEIPKRYQTGKNSADIRLCVDAMDLCYSKEHIDTFVIVSGDSDFSPLVSKLKENGKRVIGLSMKASTSDLLADNCDEFIFYEDLDDETDVPSVLRNVPKEKREVFQLLSETIRGLRRESKETLWSSMVKDTMKRKKPSFSESAYGYRSFSDLLEDAQRYGLIDININSRSGTYVVVGFADGQSLATPAPTPAPTPTTAVTVAPTPAAPAETPRQRTATRARRRTWRKVS